jgi:two-component system response regulator YesN
MRVMIVEDEALQRRAVAQLVHDLFPAAEVIQAADGLAAIDQANQSPPDAVFLDIRMPRVDGLAAARRIKLVAPEAALFVLTAHEHFEYAKQAIGLGVDQYLLKPVAPEDIERCLGGVQAAIDARAVEGARQAETRQMLAAAMPLLAAQFVRDLCSGSIDSQVEYRDRASLFDLSGEPELAIAIGLSGPRSLMDTPVRPPALSEAELELARRRATTIIEDVFAGYPGTVLIGRTRHDELVVLVELSQLRAAGRQPLEVVRRLLTAAVERCQPLTLQMVAGIGTPAAGPLSLWRSYRAAQRARERASLLVDAGQPVIAARDLGDESDQLLRYPLLAERGLAEVVRAGFPDQACRYLPQLVDFFAGTGTQEIQVSAVATVRSRALECLAILARAAGDGGAAPEEVHALSTQAFDSALRAVSGGGLATVVANLARSLSALVAQSQAARQSGLAARAAALLEGHYPEEVSLTGIASELHVSSFYLSHIFRQSTGITFSEYLTKLRMDEAKRLLEVTDLPVVEVAARVGYREPNYFGRVFKRVNGMTPLAWRRSARATRYD